MPARQVLLLDLKDDPALIAAYERWHAPGGVPKAVIRSIRAAGISSMDIFRSGNRLVMVLETGPSSDSAANAASDPSDPDVIAWERLMDDFQQRLPWAEPGVKWTRAHRIFALADHP